MGAGVDLPLTPDPSAVPPDLSPSGVVVTGTGSAAVPPDVATVRLAAFAARPALTDALDVADTAARAMSAALAAGGVAAADATTSGLSVTPEQTWTEGRGNRITGFRAEHAIILTVRDLATLGTLVADVLAAGRDAATLYGIDFSVADPAPGLARARELAWRDAADAARQLAELAGRRLGAVRAVLEGDSAGGPAPMPRALAARSEVAITPGDVTLTSVLTVHWDLN